MIHSVKFFSQQRYKYKDIGCGAASLMMLMHHHHLPIRVPKYLELCQCLWLTVDPEIKGWPRKQGKGAFTSDVERVLLGLASPQDEHILFSSVKGEDVNRARNGIKRALNFGPVMAAVAGEQFGRNGHWIVITGQEDGELVYFDPFDRFGERRTLARADFQASRYECGYYLKHPCKCDIR